MCLIAQDNSAKARRMIVIGCACLSIALSQRALLPAAASETTRHWLSGVFGLLIGMSIALNLKALWLSKHSRH